MNCWNSSSYRDRPQGRAQEQEQDQNQRNVFREIGNVDIDIDNTNIAIAILAILAFLSGSLDSTGIRTLLDRFLDNNAAGQ